MALAPPTITVDSTNNDVAHDINLTFVDDATWRSAITDITVNGDSVVVNSYEVTSGNIQLQSLNFEIAREYEIVIIATGYDNTTTITQTVTVAKWSDLTLFEITDSAVFPISTNELATYENIVGQDLDNLVNIHSWTKKQLRHDIEIHWQEFQREVRTQENDEYFNIINYIKNPLKLKELAIYYAFTRLFGMQSMGNDDLWILRQEQYEARYKNEKNILSLIEFDTPVKEVGDGTYRHITLTR